MKKCPNDLNRTMFFFTFMNWDYVHGLFSADGSIYVEKRNQNKRLKITLKQREVIRQIASFLTNQGFTPKVFREKKILKDGTPREYWTVRLNKQREISLFTNKKPPHLSLDFIAGFSDGDGCFRFYNTKGNLKPLKMFTFHVSKERKIKLLKDIKKFLESGWKIRIREYHKQTYQFSITNKKSYELFKDLMNKKLYVKTPV